MCSLYRLDRTPLSDFHPSQPFTEAATQTAGQQLALKPVKPLALAWRNGACVLELDYNVQ